LKIDDKGLLRAHGRLIHADLPDDAKFPVLMPKQNVISKLIVLDVHNRFRHAGVSHTLSEVRQKFWIPHGRNFVRSVLHECIVCRKYKTGVPFALPDMPPFPVDRVSRSAPFKVVGVDYFGPLNVKVGDATRKMWVSLFSCLCTRAVHLEPVLDCTPAEFVNAFTRFASRRGCPSRVISDNAAQFRLAKILGTLAWRKTPTDPDLLSYLAQNGVQWNFIIELAPWQGGHYERLVGVVKSVLKTSIGRRLMSWTDLITLLAETESIVNSRPITYVNEDINSFLNVLRPIDFLVSQPVAVDSSKNVTRLATKVKEQSVCFPFGSNDKNIWKRCGACITINICLAYVSVLMRVIKTAVEVF